MNYFINSKIIDKFNQVFGLKLDFQDTNFNIMIYLYEHPNEWKDLNDLQCFFLIKFLVNNDIFMILDYINYLCKKCDENQKPLKLHYQVFQREFHINDVFGINQILEASKKREKLLSSILPENMLEVNIFERFFKK